MKISEFILKRAMQKEAGEGNWFKDKYEQATDWLARKMLGSSELERRDILEPGKPVTLGSSVPVYTDGKLTGKKPAFNMYDIRSAIAHNNQQRIDDARKALDENNGLLHPMKEIMYSKEMDKAIEDSWNTAMNAKNLPNMTFMDAAKKYPRMFERGSDNYLSPDAHMSNTILKYWPNLDIQPSDIKGLYRLEGTYPEWYKSAFTDPAVATEAYNLSQQVRSDASPLKFKGYQPMASWFPKYSLSDMLSLGGKKEDKHRVLLYDSPAFNDAASVWQRIADASRVWQALSEGDRSDRANAYIVGPHVNLNGGVVPEGRNFKASGALAEQLGPSATVRETGSHEFDHISTNTFTGSNMLKDFLRMRKLKGAGEPWSTNARNFYSMIPDEADRVLHSIKALSSNLTGKAITNFDEAVKILQANNLINYNDKGEAAFNYDIYNKLLNEGKIKPTDPSMIIDLLNLDANMRNTDYATGTKLPVIFNYADWVYQNAVDPRTGEPLNNNGKYTMNFKELWSEMLQHRFEMADANNRKHRPGLGYNTTITT